MAKLWFPTLRSGLETKGLAERVRSSNTLYTVSGAPYQQHWDTGRAVREGFQANPWVFRAVEVMAHAALSRKIVLRDGDPENGTLIPMRNDPTRALFVLNRRANPWESAKMLRYRLFAQWLLSSKGLFLEIAKSRAGRIATITLIDPDLVSIVPSKTNPISAFQIRTTGDTGGGLDELPPFDPENPEVTNSILWLRSPHPTVLTQGMSPMEAAGLSIDLDKYARLYNRDYMQQGGRPGGILGVRGSVDPDTVTALQRRFNADARPGQTTAIQADAMFYQDLSTSPRDMQWGEVMDRMRKEASIVFGVPESMMGDASGKTFDNADAEYAIFLEHRFAPLVGMIDDQLDILTGAQVDDTYLVHDLSDVWVLKRHRREEEDRMAADLARGAITMNDYREFKGLPPIDAPWARVHWIAPNLLAGYDGAPGDATQAAAAPMGGQVQQPDPNAGLGGDQSSPLAALAAGGGGAPLAIGPGSGGDGTQLRLVAGQAQDRSTSGGTGGDGLTEADARTPELEGKQSRARDHADGPDRAGRPSAPTWR